MIKCKLRWSLFELGFVSACHLMAAISVLLAELLIGLELAIVIAVLVSYLVYLRDQFQMFIVPRRGTWQRLKPELIIGQQSARLSRFGKLREMQLPRVVYFSEFLLVLSFHPESERGSTRAVHLVLWPDSLERSEAARLRRYLRFDLPSGLAVN
ncbi:MAG: hypothetical protein JKY29_12185 [Gammaproteobacteria bacterium]|nr:hypothetical protein [Gammaproteobacteria bacterium]